MTLPGERLSATTCDTMGGRETASLPFRPPYVGGVERWGESSGVYDMDTVYCVVKTVDGVPVVCMIHATKEKAEDSCREMNGYPEGGEGYRVERHHLHN